MVRATICDARISTIVHGNRPPVKTQLDRMQDC